MSVLDQVAYRVPTVGGRITPVAASAESFRDPKTSQKWQQWLDPWLRIGGPADRCYLNLGEHTTLIRWRSAGASSSLSWLMAHLLLGTPATLPISYGLQLPALPDELGSRQTSGQLPRLSSHNLAMESTLSDLENRARSSAAAEVLVPLLSRVLAGDRSIVMPWQGRRAPEAILWGLASILTMIGDARPLSFMTKASTRPPDLAGLFITFRQEQPKPIPDPRYESPAIGLVTSYADGPERLRQTLAQHGIAAAIDHEDRVRRLFDLWPPHVAPPPHPQPPAANGTAPVHRGDTQTVICPICLQEIKDWESLPRWRWDGSQYVDLKIPPEASGPQRSRMERAAFVCCPDQLHVMQSKHYLPAEYGRLGQPVVLGFVGLTRSGKSHLMAAMVGAIERGDLRKYGIDSYPLDIALHNEFLEEKVWPLLKKDSVLPGTEEGIVTFADAFVVSPAGGIKRPVALFDVAGGELTKVGDTKLFLDVADGLFFIVDPAELQPDGPGDRTFNTVLDLLKGTPRLPNQVSAAVVLNKADLVRFEDPVARLLRSDVRQVDAAEFLSESADVYAFLSSKGAAAWARPYEECVRATLHVASPTGGAAEGDVFPRHVTPQRVLRPLVAMLAMTGVLTGAEAERVGI